jgi:tRNA A-37 threonylcarbamoyl transferase component Bud32
MTGPETKEHLEPELSESIELVEAESVLDASFVGGAEAAPDSAVAADASVAVDGIEPPSPAPDSSAAASSAPVAQFPPAEQPPRPMLSPFILTVCVLLSLCSLSLKNLFPSDQTDWYLWGCISWQLVWTIWQLSINREVCQWLRRAIVSPWEIVLVSILGFCFLPPFEPDLSWQYPSLWIWYLCQFWFYLRVAPHVLGLESGKALWVKAFLLGFLATAFVPIGILFHELVSPALSAYFHSLGLTSTALGHRETITIDELFTVTTGVIFQSVALAILSFKLAGDLRPPAQVGRKNDARMQIERDGTTITIPYQSFAGIDRFRKQSFHLRGRTIMETMFLGFAIPLAMTVYTIGSYSYLATDIARYIGLGSSAGPAPVKVVSDFRAQAGVDPLIAHVRSVVAREQEIAEKVVNGLFVNVFLTLMAALSGGAILYCLSRFDRLALGPSGLRLLRRRKMLPDKDWLGWDGITKIEFARKSGQSGAGTGEIVFHSGRTAPLKIPLAAFETPEQKAALLEGIKLYGSAIQRDPQLEEILELPADRSYTELWLAALSGAPKRERLKPLSSGATLGEGKYTIEKTIGSGGQGHAYLAVDHENSGTVVLKEFILPVYVELDVRKSALAQFETEARILKGLNHEQIVKLRDFFVEDHRAYLVLEHIEGVSLRQLLREKGPMSEAQVISLAAQMCDILKFLHEQSPPVVHRDFTPDNLILRKDGTLKLIDFDVARQSAGGTLGTVVGKHAYMPPEQFRGEAVVASDIYSLGGCLFFLLSGRDPEPISQSCLKDVREDVSAGLSEIIEKSTHPELQKRFRSAEQVSGALQELQNRRGDSESESLTSGG